MNCPRCGTPVAPGTAFCSRCGLPVAQMQAGPGYGAPGQAPLPPKKSGAAVVLIVLAVVFGGGIFLVAILAAILFPVFAKTREKARLVSCESNVKQISLGLMQYMQDNNDKFPPSAGAYKDAVFPYIKSEQVFHCPTDTSGSEDYSLNTNLQGKSLEKLSNPAMVVAVYEGRSQTLNFRHDNQAVVGFADGHVKAITREQAQDLQWKP